MPASWSHEALGQTTNLREYAMNHIDSAQSDRRPIHIEGYGLGVKADDRKPIHIEEDWGY